jgi:hypothetical protein
MGFKETRYALLVGSNNYSEGYRLKFPLDDVSDIKTNLIKRCNFKEENIIEIKFDIGDTSSPGEIVEKAFNSISTSFNENKDTFLFYYSGHGIYEENEKKSYLELSDEFRISIQDIVDKINLLQSKNTYLIIDACNSGGGLDFVPKNKTEKKLLLNASGIYCIFGATKKGIALDELSKNKTIKYKLKNSLFTHFLIEALNKKALYFDGYINIDIIKGYIKPKISKLSEFVQIPASISRDEGSHILGTWNDSTPDFIDDIDNLKVNPDNLPGSHEAPYVFLKENNEITIFWSYVKDQFDEFIYFRKLTKQGFRQERKAYNSRINFGNFVKSEENYYFNVWYNSIEKKLYLDRFNDDGLPLGMEGSNIDKFDVEHETCNISVKNQHIAVLYQGILSHTIITKKGEARIITPVKRLGTIVRLAPGKNFFPIKQTSNYVNLAVNKNGCIMVAYGTRTEDDRDYKGLEAKLFDKEGNIISELILQEKHNPANIFVLSNDNEFLIAWQDSNKIMAQKIDFAGQILFDFYIPLSEEDNLSDIAINNDEMVIAWTEKNLEESDYSSEEGYEANTLFAQKFDLNGQVTVSKFQVNSTDLLFNGSGKCSINKNGDFVIAWSGSNERYKSYAHSYDRGRFDLYLSLFKKDLKEEDQKEKENLENSLIINDLIIEQGQSAYRNVPQRIINFALYRLKFQIKNISNLVENSYKFEFWIPSSVHNKSSNPHITDENNMGKEGEYTIFSFPNTAPIFQEEKTIVLNYTVNLTKSTYLSLLKNGIKTKLYTKNGIDEKFFSFNEKFYFRNFDNKLLEANDFK